MNESTPPMPSVTKRRASLLKVMLLSWLLIGTLDILVAGIQSVIYGGNPVRMLQFIASGIFGKRAFAGGAAFAAYGLVLHYVIAFIWTFIFFKLYGKLRFVAKNWVLAGIVYGIIVWLLMNRVVLPLSNTPPLKFHLVRSIISVLVIIGAIGLPLSWMFKRYVSTGVNVPRVVTKQVEN